MFLEVFLVFCEEDKIKIGVVGLGYVGLPLSVELARCFSVVGFDIRKERILQLCKGKDSTREVDEGALLSVDGIEFTADFKKMSSCNVFVITVPTPIDGHRKPDLGPLLSATRTVGRVLRKGSVVIYESTVYPGATEEDCAPVLEEESGLTLNRDFFLGYSPERVNPGDRAHRIPDIVKVTSGSTPEAAAFVDRLYGRIVPAGTHLVSSIRVAEAAKVIENTQRDVNIALVNELAILFNRLGLDTEEVLTAAGTKWNFLPFRPGLVGGHCIGVDPYYLTHKAQEVGHHPEMILAGRRVNDGMGGYIADMAIKALARSGFPVVNSRVLVMGLSFKENCPDLRNTRVVDVVRQLSVYNARVDVWDPWVDPAEARNEYDISILQESPDKGSYEAVILAVPHKEFVESGVEAVRELAVEGGIIFDVKSVFPADSTDMRL